MSNNTMFLSEEYVNSLIEDKKLKNEEIWAANGFLPGQPIGKFVEQLCKDLGSFGFRHLPKVKAQQIMLITLFEILVNLNEHAKQDTSHEPLGDEAYEKAILALQDEVDFMHQHVATLLPMLDSDDRSCVPITYNELLQRYCYYIDHIPNNKKRREEVCAVEWYCKHRIYQGFMYDYARMVQRHIQVGDYVAADYKNVGYGLGCNAIRSIYDTRSGQRTLEIFKLIKAVKTPGCGTDLYLKAVLQAIRERQQLVQKESH